jgi:hypothetical protein
MHSKQISHAESAFTNRRALKCGFSAVALVNAEPCR